MEGSWRLRPLLFVGVGYCLEEGAPLAALEGLVLSQICLAHVGGDTQQVVCVEGILHWTKEEGGSTSLQWIEQQGKRAH
jgi:hypothetical protein